MHVRWFVLLCLVGVGACKDRSPPPDVAPANFPAVAARVDGPSDTVVDTVLPLREKTTTTFGSFAAETSTLSDRVGCRNGKITHDNGYPDLWGCIAGEAETVKLFVNENDEKNGRVENVKLMWNDWTENIGYGLHADKTLAMQWAAVVAQHYAPRQKKSIVHAFGGKRNVEVRSGKFQFTYTYEQGPAIGEHLLVITSRP